MLSSASCSMWLRDKLSDAQIVISWQECEALHIGNIYEEVSLEFVLE